MAPSSESVLTSAKFRDNGIFMMAINKIFATSGVPTPKYEMVPVTPKASSENTEPLYRIRALRDFGPIKTGDMGGYVSSERNLSHEGLCWIYEDAMATGHSNVSGNAKLHDFVRISENVKISGNAKLSHVVLIDGNVDISGDVEISDQAILSGNARISGNARLGGWIWIYGNTQISGNVHLFEERKIGGNTCINADNKGPTPPAVD